MFPERSTPVEEPEVARLKILPIGKNPPSLNLLRSEAAPSRRKSFAIGFLVQLLLLLALIRMGAYVPRVILEKPRESVVLIAPRLTEPEPVPHIVAPRLPKQLPPPQVQPRLETPPVEPPPVEAKIEPKPLPPPVPRVEPPKPKVAINTFASPAPPMPAKPEAKAPEVKANVFAGNSAPPTIKAPARQVQTGGFGDPNGFKGNTEQTAKLNAPKLGGFDHPSGPGDGNGLAGAQGSPGIVASAGFGSGTAVSVPQGTRGGRIQQGGFGDAQFATASSGVPKREAMPATTPVRIVEKPQPQYTKEARDLKVEGEVHLKVLFQADGSVRVLQVVQGLGHGLDEAAMAAAQKIRFKPAERDGRPCDMEATVHILFQLAG